MAKRVRRTHHRRRRVRASRVGLPARGRKNTGLRNIEDRRSPRLLDRILAAPQLAQVVPRLQPELLHRLIQHCGLEDCGELVALATPAQLARVFDLDLWRPAAPGREEQFDAARFGEWVEVMVDAGVAPAAATLAAMDVDLVASGLAQHVRVFDYAAVAPFRTLDGDVSSGRDFEEGLRCEIGGYVVVERGSGPWDAITTVLMALADAHGASFDRVMRACCRLSDSRPEMDGLDELLIAGDQAVFDLGVARATRRDRQGYVAAAQARAFLQASRRIDLRSGVQPLRDPVTSACVREVEAAALAASDTEPGLPPDDKRTPAPDAASEAVSAIVELLQEAGVTARPPRGLLAAAQTSAPRLERVLACLQFAHDRDADAYAARSAELAYLANVIVAGTTIQSRPVTPEQASEAAVSVCNLGLENWPAHWPADARRADFLVRHDLVSVFQVGWTVLHEEVCMYAADALIGIATSFESADEYLLDAMNELRITLTRSIRTGSPWDGRAALDTIAMLDGPSWAALCALIDECPTFHAAVDGLLAGTARQIDASAFEFISENAQIRRVREFMQALPRIWCG